MGQNVLQDLQQPERRQVRLSGAAGISSSSLGGGGRREEDRKQELKRKQDGHMGTRPVRRMPRPYTRGPRPAISSRQDVRRWALPAQVPDGPEPEDFAPTNRQADGLTSATRGSAATATVRRALRRGGRLVVMPRPLPTRTRTLGVANFGFLLYNIAAFASLTHTAFHLSIRICTDTNCIVGQLPCSNTAHTF